MAGLAACGGGGGGGPGGGGTPAPPGPPASGGPFTITGSASYDSVPANGSGVGLNYAAITLRPIRGASVELRNAAGGLLATATTNEQGVYSFSVNNSEAVFVRVRAEIKRAASAGAERDITVRDNTAAGEPLYVLDSAGFTPTSASTTQNLRAASGWGGTSYTALRAAGPFAILDAIYSGQAKVATTAPSAGLAPLQVFWSVNNRPVSGALNTGAIGTSFFTSGTTGGRRLYLLGAENTDTDEYDSHVVAHEYGHYLQSAVSRDDSVGGPHTGTDRLDMRVAFSEGWGNAWSGMALGSPIYTDSLNARQAGGFPLDVSTPPPSNRGWYSEASAQYLLWTAHETPGIGFAPIYSALTSLGTAPSLTSLYSFAAALKTAAPSAATTINNLWGGQLIATQDAFGSAENNNGGNAANLPVYKPHLAAQGVTQNYCVRGDAGLPNKLGNFAYIRFTAAGTRTLTVTRSSSVGTSDPDFVLLRADGQRQAANSAVADQEVLANVSLPTGSHVIALSDFNLPNLGTSCFDFKVD